MNWRSSSAAMFVTLLVVAGCASAPPPAPPPAPKPECSSGPDWTCFKSGACPSTTGLVGICARGTADNITSEALGTEVATTRARTEMASYIESQVQAFVNQTQDSMYKSGAGEEATQKVKSMAQSVTKRTLNGVGVPKTYVDRERKLYYALAQLDAKTFGDALKGLKDAGTLSDSVKQDINKRADAIVDEFERASARKN